MATFPPGVAASSSASNRLRNIPSTVKPFDYPDADVVVRSSDYQDFRVQKVFLVKSSPVLARFIEAASNRSEATLPIGHGGARPLPVVRLFESGAILYSLLTFVLPVAPVLPPTLEKTMELLSTAQKYEMSHILARIRGSISLKDPPPVNEGNALYAFHLARKYGLHQEVVHAAGITLRFTLTVETLEDMKMLDVMPGTHLRELWKYHQFVQDKLAEDVDRFRRSDARRALEGLDCNWTSEASKIPQWIDEYIVRMACDPSLFDLTEFHNAMAQHIGCTVEARNHIARLGCSYCVGIPGYVMNEFWMAVTTFVRANIRKAEAVFSTSRKNKPPQSHTSQASATVPLPDCLELGAADIVLQSSDFVNFRVHKPRLAVASPLFRDMFSLPQPSNDETVDGLPSVRLSEDAQIVRALITALYGTRLEIPSSYERVLTLLGATQKYEMPAVKSSILDKVGKVPAPAKAQVYREYAIAFSNGLSNQTKIAARFTLDFPLTFKALGEDLALFEGSALRSLADYRKRCRDSVVSCLESFLDARKGPSKIWVGCTGSDAQQPQSSGCRQTSLKQSSRRHSERRSTNGSTPKDKNESTLPLWLWGFFIQQIEECEQYLTKSLIDPSSIRWKYLAALQKHAPDQNGCISCLVVHAHSGEGYCAKLEQRLTRARNDPEFLCESY